MHLPVGEVSLEIEDRFSKDWVRSNSESIKMVKHSYITAMAVLFLLVYFLNKNPSLDRARVGTKELSGISCLTVVARPLGT